MDITSIGPVVGTVTSVVDPSDIPEVDGQTNSSLFEGVSFAECDDGLVALVDDEWLWLYLYQIEG